MLENILNKHGQTAIDLDDNLLRSGLIDSVAMIQLVNFIQDSFGVNVPFQDFTVTNFKSINVMASYLENRMSQD